MTARPIVRAARTRKSSIATSSISRRRHSSMSRWSRSSISTYELIGVSTSSAGKPPYAIIADRSGQQNVYGLGQTVPNAGKLVEVDKDRAVIDHNGKRVALSFPRMTCRVRSRARSRSRLRSRTTTRTRSGQFDEDALSIPTSRTSATIATRFRARHARPQHRQSLAAPHPDSRDSEYSERQDQRLRAVGNRARLGLR